MDEPEIADFHVEVPIEQQVRRLEVAVQQARGMNVRHSACNVHHNALHQHPIELDLAFVEHVEQGSARHELRDHHVRRRLGTRAKTLDDVRMIQLAHDADLGLKFLDHLPVPHHLAIEELDGDSLVLEPPLVHGSKSAFSQLVAHLDGLGIDLKLRRVALAQIDSRARNFRTLALLSEQIRVLHGFRGGAHCALTKNGVRLLDCGIALRRHHGELHRFRGAPAARLAHAGLSFASLVVAVVLAVTVWCGERESARSVCGARSQSERLCQNVFVRCTLLQARDLGRFRYKSLLGNVDKSTSHVGPVHNQSTLWCCS
mmetsp:Transcript_2922/g.8025  ORF Transcript_2922/g.8025 Transcript_2922/m.8025 type:complete len:315 (+) Transcript_2922:697-1641(+)